MAKKLSSIELTWLPDGTLYHKILRGYSKKSDNINLIFAPSLPMIISHQLGTFKPSNGLILCSAILNYYQREHHSKQPINSVLKSAEIIYIQTRRGIGVQFKPNTKLFSKSDIVEKGVRSLLNNYIAYVNSFLDGDIKQIIKSMVGLTVEVYLNMLQDAFDKEIIGPKKVRWDVRFSYHMTHNNLMMEKHFGVEYQNEEIRREKQEYLDNQYKKIIIKFNSICRALELTRSQKENF